MSKLEVDAIEPQSGTTLTIGASGDTITIPSGATLSSTDPLVFPAGTVSLPAITTTGDTNTGIFFPAADTIAFTEGGAEAMRIDSAGDVGIGTSDPKYKLHVRTSNDKNLYIRDGYRLAGVALQTVNNAETLNVPLEINADGAELTLSGTPITFTNNGTERMRIDSSGTLFIGKTTTAVATTGLELYADGFCQQTRSAATVQLFNRTTSDGIIVDFRQQGTSEGNISVSGSTVSYNGFTGTHWSRFQDNSAPTILRGTVLESLDEMCDWYNLEFDVTTTTQDEDGNDVTNTVTEKVPHVLADGQSNGDVITYNHEGTDYQATIVKEADIKHMMSKVSDNSDAKNVYGVFVAYDEDGEGYNDFYVASVGSFVVRIKANETIAKGDLLQSNGDGTAKVQTDDNVKSSSFAKVLSTTVIETYEDGSYLVPCSLMC
jgi:hypothetical protein